MATWHQKRNPVRLWHETQWTVVIDPPDGMTSLYRTEREAEAQEYLRNLPKNSHAYIVRPAAGGSQ